MQASLNGSYLVLLDRRLHRQVPQGRRRLPARRDLRFGSVKKENCLKGYVMIVTLKNAQRNMFGVLEHSLKLQLSS